MKPMLVVIIVAILLVWLCIDVVINGRQKSANNLSEYERGYRNGVADMVRLHSNPEQPSKEALDYITNADRRAAEKRMHEDYLRLQENRRR